MSRFRLATGTFAGVLLAVAACSDSSAPVATASPGNGAPASSGSSSSGSTGSSGATSSGGTTPTAAADPDPATLCASTACGRKLRLLAIPDAENIEFSDDGRLFVSGGTNVFEVTRSGTAFAARPLIATGCNATGLAIRANTLYANCGDTGMLHAAPLAATAAAQALLAPIHATGLSLANGLVAGPDGSATLFAVEGPIAARPRVVRLVLDPADPLRVLAQSDWLTTGLQMPNGLQRRGDVLYVMNSNALAAEGTQILAVPIAADGSAGAVRKVAALTVVGDDFALVRDHFLVVDFGTGGLTLLGPDGSTKQSVMVGSFDNPSHVAVTRGPMFKPGQLLVTEKGPLRENDSIVGNALSLLHPASDASPLPP